MQQEEIKITSIKNHVDYNCMYYIDYSALLRILFRLF